MKKTLSLVLVFSLVFMILFNGCGISIGNKPKAAANDSSPENLVPLGEYVDICPDKQDVQVCILKIISGEEAKRLFDTDKDLIIVKFNMKAVSLNGEEFRASSDMCMVLNNGTIKNDDYTYKPKEILGIPRFSEDTFAAEGAIDCVAVFWVDIDECRYLKYGSSAKKDETYFAIRE